MARLHNDDDDDDDVQHWVSVETSKDKQGVSGGYGPFYTFETFKTFEEGVARFRYWMQNKEALGLKHIYMDVVGLGHIMRFNDGSGVHTHECGRVRVGQWTWYDCASYNDYEKKRDECIRGNAAASAVQPFG